MARYRASTEAPWTQDEAFTYLSDFSTSAEWDPGVVKAARVGTGVVGEGTEFRLVAKFMGRETHLTYDADLRLKGPLRLADPLLAVAFNRVGDRALAGLRDVLRRPGHGPVDAAA